jgi:predicted ATP-grasp superfamily ATP-dependent carboligase
VRTRSPAALILDARYRPALAAVRGLGRRGVEVIAADCDAAAASFVSRWCTRWALLPDVAEDADAYVERVIDLCRSLDSPVLIAHHDGTIEALRSRRDEVEQVASLALASEEALSIAVDKEATLAAAQALGISTPPTRIIGSVTEITKAVDGFGLPLVIKPQSSWVKRGAGGSRRNADVAWTRDAAHAGIKRLLDDGASPMIQPWLSGSREAVSIFLAHGTICAKFGVRSARMYPVIGGVDVVRETMDIPEDIGWMAESLVRELSLEGYSHIEFRRDRNGRAFLMEVNPRLSAGIEVAVRAGIDVPALLYEWAAGRPVRPRLHYRTGQRMRWLPGDVRWLVEALRCPAHPDAPSRHSAVATFLRDFCRRSGYDWWDRDDTRPALHIASHLLRRVGEGALS